MTEKTDKTAESAEEASSDDKSPDEQPEQTLLEQMGGVSGLIYSSVPVLVFVLVNTFFGLTAAIWGSLGVAVAITVFRVVRKEPIQPAISGLLGVGVAVLIANWTGTAKGFFLLGIWASLVYGSICVISMAARRPLIGLIWSYLNNHGSEWRSDRKAMNAYQLATLTWALVFFARFIVQRWLYDEDQTGWLAFARLAMGYPLTALAVVVTVWAVTRAGHRVKKIKAEVEETDREVEERLRAKYAGKPEPEGA
jgi:Protein of unknown function (DUF3159)